MGILRWLIGRAIYWLPDVIIRSILPKKYGYRKGDLAPTLDPKPVAVNLLIAPVNWAGQGYQWAHSVGRNIPNVAAVSLAYRMPGGYGHQVDVSVPVAAYVTSRVWYRAQKNAILNGFSHVLVEACRHPFGRIFYESVERQIDDLLNHSVKVALLFHGSDIRVPSRHFLHNPFSPFGPGSSLPIKKLERDAKANQGLADTLNIPVFVSTPDLLEDVPQACWLPVVVDVDRWLGGSEPLEKKVPIVVHAPSKEGMKGTDLIEETMLKLDREGIVEYRRLYNIPARQMPDEIRASDIVLDQFRIGAYGVASVEAMAAGRVVVANVVDLVRDIIRNETGHSLPIVQALPTDLETIIREIVDARPKFQTVAMAGEKFAREVHDGRFSASVLKPFLLS